MKNKNIRTINDEGQAHGYWERYIGKILYYKGFFHNGKLIGYREYYTLSRDKLIKTFNII